MQINGHIQAIKTIDESVNNSDVLQDDDALLFAIGANETWRFYFYVVAVNSNITPDIKVSLNGPALTTLYASIFGPRENYTWRLYRITAYDVTSMFSTTINEYWVIRLSGYITCSAAGNVVLRWAQDTPTVVNTTVCAGSWVEAQRVS